MLRYIFILSVLFIFSGNCLAIPAKFQDAAMTRRLDQRDIATYMKAGARGATPELKAIEWKACHQEKSRVFSVGEDIDSVPEFIESRHVISNLEEMDKRSLLAGRVLVSPWSGDYWPYASGLLAARYQVEEFLREFDWLGKYNYVQKHPMSQVIQEQGQNGVDVLSPSEKYDLLTGSREPALTQVMWQEGKEYQDNYGEVEGWMGICHGWAPAAIMEERPTQAIVLRSMNDRWNLPLLPSEIKGLVSYSWATNSYSSMTLGSRCHQKNPARDENGRLIDRFCQDLNPGVWHEVVVNMVGRQKRSFVMDATYDYQVWNQPVKEYSYVYFNPSTGMTSGNFKEVVQKISDVQNDPYAKYRSPDAKYIIGVNMKLAYVSETSANNSTVDVEENDSIVWVEYSYDLELDNNYQILGGEWRTEGHPDFVWVPKKGTSPQTAYDYAVGISQWSAQENKLPQAWAVVARTASSQGKVLHSIIEEIINRSK